MGGDGSGVGSGGGLRLSSIARVVPAVPSFSVDAGFRYAIPERFAGRVGVGTMVRVPLGGRRVGGYVIGVEEGDTAGLKELAAISGAASIFDQPLFEVMRWAAGHYVAPLSVMLARCAPPNNPPPSAAAPTITSVPPEVSHPLDGILDDGARRPTVWLGSNDAEQWTASLGAKLRGTHRSLVVILATGDEVRRLATAVRSPLGEHLVTVDHEMDDAGVTAAWARMRHHGGILLGTPRVASWLVPDLAVVAVVEESRRAMKDRQTPTVHVRDLLMARATRTGVTALFAGPAPSLELVARGPRIMRPPGRLFPLVEIVDRRDDPPGSGMLSERVRQAIRVTVNRGGNVFVFAHRRGYSAASRCVRCRTLRRCPECGSRPDPTPECRRCGAELGPCVECGGARFEPLGAGVGRIVDDIARIVDEVMVGEHPTSAPVAVGTERDLTTLDFRDLVVVVDIDGLVFGVDYRAAEEAFRIGSRLATHVRPGTGRRLMVQTNDPEHPVISALRRGDPHAFHETELETRRAMHYPPFGSLLVIEARGEGAMGADPEIQVLSEQATILGPAPSAGGVRWLVQGDDLRSFKTALRPVLQRMRDSGITFRVDVDPIDL